MFRFALIKMLTTFWVHPSHHVAAKCRLWESSEFLSVIWGTTHGLGKHCRCNKELLKRQHYGWRTLKRSQTCCSALSSIMRSLLGSMLTCVCQQEAKNGRYMLYIPLFKSHKMPNSQKICTQLLILWRGVFLECFFFSALELLVFHYRKWLWHQH